MAGQGLKLRLKGRFIAAVNKVTFRRRKKCQVTFTASKPSSPQNDRQLVQKTEDLVLYPHLQGDKHVPDLTDGSVDSCYRDGPSTSTSSQTGEGDATANSGAVGSEDMRSGGANSDRADGFTSQAQMPRATAVSNSSQALVLRYVRQARSQEAALTSTGAESNGGTIPLREISLRNATRRESIPAETPKAEAEQPADDRKPEPAAESPPAAASPASLPEEDLNALLCTVATHMWIAETPSELEMLGEMVDILVRGGASDFLPAIIKGCWAASLTRTGVNLPQKLAVFSKMVREGAPLLTPNQLFEALRVAAMACACVWADREGAGRTGKGCPVRALLEVIRVLIRAGASNVNRVIRDVISYKIDSVEVVRIFLQEGCDDIDVNRALRHATACSSHVNILRCLIKEGGAWELSRPLMLAAINGSLPAVKLFRECGCTDSGSLYGALYCAVTAGQCELMEYLLGVLPGELGHDDLFELLKSAAADESAGQGVVHLLRCNVMGSESLTIAAADSLAARDSTRPELRAVLQEHWTSEAYETGRAEGRQHDLNFAVAVCRGDSGLRLRELPVELQVAIAYRGLFESCANSGGLILPQRLKGELGWAVGSLYSGEPGSVGGDVRWMSKDELLGRLSRRLPTHGP